MSFRRGFCIPLLAAVNALAQLPTVTEVVNGASFRPGIAAGSWISVRGTNLSTTTRLWNDADFQGNRLPTSLDGVSVRVNNRAAAVYFISPTQVNALAPADPATGPVQVTVTNARGASAPATAMLQAIAPAFFPFQPQNSRYAAAVHPDGTFVGRAGLFGQGVTTLPAAPGGTIILFGNAFGLTNPAASPDVIFQGAAPLVNLARLRILINNIAATIRFAGLVSTGLYQFNIDVPNLPDGDHALVAEIDDQRSQPNLFLTILRPPPAPEITELSNPDMVWGQEALFTIRGRNLSGATRVEFTPPDGLTIRGNLSTAAAFVGFSLTVEEGASEGDRTVAVVTAGGRSNAFPLKVRRGSPRITSFTPRTAWPERFYTSGGLRSLTHGVYELTGEDLAGARRIEVSPPDGVRIFFTPSMTSLPGYMILEPDAPPGQRRVVVESPGGRSNEVTFEIVPAPSNAPRISNVSVEVPTTGFNSLGYSGRLDFADSDGDIRTGMDSASLVRLMLELPIGGISLTTVEGSGSFLDKAGQTSGAIAFTFSRSAGFALRWDGEQTVLVVLIDAQGNLSNFARARVARWLSPLF